MKKEEHEVQQGPVSGSKGLKVHWSGCPSILPVGRQLAHSEQET